MNQVHGKINIYTQVVDCACPCHCLSFSHSIAFFSSFFTFLQYSISALVIWIAPRCSGKRQFQLSVSVCFAVMTRSPGDGVAIQASRLGLSHWAGPSVTRSTRVSQRVYRGVMVDILAKESKFP